MSLSSWFSTSDPLLIMGILDVIRFLVLKGFLTVKGAQHDLKRSCSDPFVTDVLLFSSMKDNDRKKEGRLSANDFMNVYVLPITWSWRKMKNNRPGPCLCMFTNSH